MIPVLRAGWRPEARDGRTPLRARKEVTGARRRASVPAAGSALTGSSEARVYGFALQGEDAEDALVDAVEGVPPDEALQGLDAEGELA